MVKVEIIRLGEVMGLDCTWKVLGKMITHYLGREEDRDGKQGISYLFYPSTR